MPHVRRYSHVRLCPIELRSNSEPAKVPGVFLVPIIPKAKDRRPEAAITVDDNYRSAAADVPAFARNSSKRTVPRSAHKQTRSSYRRSEAIAGNPDRMPRGQWIGRLTVQTRSDRQADRHTVIPRAVRCKRLEEHRGANQHRRWSQCFGPEVQSLRPKKKRVKRR